MLQLDQLLAIGAVLLLLGAVAALISRKRGLPWELALRTSRGQTIAHVKTRLSLTHQHMLHVVSYREKEFVVITHPAGASVLQEPATFRSVLNTAELAQPEAGA